MGDFLSVAAKLFRNKYVDDLFERHTPARKSNVAFREGGIEESLRNQLTTMRLTERYRDMITGKRVLVLDNFLTWGPSMETPRNLLFGAGAKAIIAVGVGKYGPSYHIASAPAEPWDPFDVSVPDAGSFAQVRSMGDVRQEALAEFLASYQAMQNENW